ncbi:MAG TPA: Ku protein [Actinomycetes bacterium]|nr:Ku protein [Actinomycetes bacterium]
MQTVWKGSIAFGMVSIPIRLVSATEERDVPLRQVHDADGGRIKYRRFCSIDGEEVPYSHIAKGYEISDDDVVVLTDDDLANLPIASTKAVEVVSFADRDEINPIALSRAYYADPTGDAKPYKLLHDTLVETNKVAVVKLALRQRERLATIRPQDGVLVVQTMLWPDEVRRPQFGFLDDDVDVKKQELDMAAMFVGAFEQGFDPEKFHDQYREALQAVVDAKLSGHDIVRAPEPDAESNVIDLMDALRVSLAQAEGGGAAAAAGEETTSKKTPAKKTAKKTPAKKTPAKKTAKKTATKTAKKTAKRTAKKAPAKKTAARKTA